jgi:hypothetical protein
VRNELELDHGGMRGVITSLEKRMRRSG